METISISRFKAMCLALLEHVKQTGEPLVVTKRGVPIAHAIPPPPAAPKRSGYGAMKGTMKIVGDIVGPTSSVDEWEADWPNISSTPTSGSGT